MIAVFTLEYDADKKFKGFQLEKQHEFEDAYGDFEHSFTHYVGDPTVALRLFGEIKVRRLVHSEYSERLLTILSRVENATKSIENERTMNEKCNVHVGGHALMLVNETLLLEDACTDSLQEHLNKGWRIIAACVQPDGRRPDYILGKYNGGKDK